MVVYGVSQQEAARFGFTTNEGFSGFSAFDVARNYGKDFARYCTHQGERPLIMCHPAVSAQADDDIGPARKREFAYLASHDFVQHLADAGVCLVRGSGQAMPSP